MASIISLFIAKSYTSLRRMNSTTILSRKNSFSTTTSNWKPSNNSTSKANSLPSICETPNLYSFVLESTFQQYPSELKKIYADIEKHPSARMATAPDQTLLISTLVRIMNARYFLEVGYVHYFIIFKTKRNE